jgi:hypothetical protein
MSDLLIPGKSHFIPLEQAVKMTKLYRADRENILKPELQGKQILPICETFNREAFDYLLKEEGCVGLRFYYGMDDEMKVHIIAVGVNDKNEDMLPKAGTANKTEEDGDDDGIVENGQRCPDDCPPPSPLNE